MNLRIKRKIYFKNTRKLSANRFWFVQVNVTGNKGNEKVFLILRLKWCRTEREPVSSFFFHFLF